MFELFKKVVLAGLGVQARANEVLNEWVEAGQQNERKEARWVKDQLARLEKDSAWLDEKVQDVCHKATAFIQLPSKKEVDALAKKVDDLARRFESSGRSRS